MRKHLKKMLNRTKETLDIYDENLIDSILSDTSIDVRYARAYLRKIKHYSDIRINQEEWDEKEQELEKIYNHDRGEYLDAVKQESQTSRVLSEFEIKLMRNLEIRSNIANGNLTELRRNRRKANNVSTYSNLIESYMEDIGAIETYETTHKEKIENSETFNKSPIFRGRVLKMNMNISEIRELEKEVFTNDMMLLTLLPVEYAEKFRSTSKKDNM